MWALLLLSGCLVHLVQGVCDPSLSSFTTVNPECNYVGMCYDAAAPCLCCSVNPDDPSYSFCKAVVGMYVGDNCEKATNYLVTTFGYLIHGDGVECAGDGTSSSEPDLLNVTKSVLANYPGLIVSLPCEVCTESNPCDYFDDPAATSGIYVQFGTDLNTYYDHECALDGNDISYHVIQPCDKNKDFGITARWAVTDELNRLKSMVADITDEINFDDYNTYIEVAGKKDFKTDESRAYTSPLTLSPSVSPSVSPTVTPSVSPTDIDRKAISPCQKFSNSVSDIHFMHVGSSCRANINETWPGGRSCDSPYIVCLPQENTPAGEFLGRNYSNITHRYSVDECKQECAFDQRCLGFEFVPDMDSSRGDCNLIDDIPIGIENLWHDFYYNPKDENLYDTLDGNANALCFEKRDYCNPHFTSEDLNETMLACYCPNNRKGSYTKKVKRTVNNTRFCGDDVSMDERIRYAQANRMFHLCENWCLFNALNPELESWYWDPWKSCWRETYSADGVHRGYCDRVIRNPDSIELKFVNERSSNILSCNATRTPTEAPVDDGNTTYFLGEEFESCDEACARNNLTCAADQTARRFLNEAELLEAFSEAGHTCDVERVTMNNTRYEGWALPGLRGGSFCTNRQQTLLHLEDLDSDCNRVIGENWQRLCACY